MTGRAGRVGPYRLIAKLEQGGMAEVHLAAAEDALGSMPLRALKLMPKGLLQDPTLSDMFLDEARLAVRLNHPNVVQTMEVGEDDGVVYLAMELLEGETVHRLAQRAVESADELPVEAAIAIGLGVLQGLHYIHNFADLDGRPLGIIHRDVTPSNIHVSTSGTVKVCDFGIAKTQVQHAVTVVGMRKGKLGYLSPEQLAGVAPDARADLFACGVVLWELLTGRRAFRRGRDLHTRARRLDEVAPHLPKELADVCARALAHDREDRYPTALAMWRDLDAASRALGGPMPAVELGRWVEGLVGEDVKNLRRLAANALRDHRVVETRDRPTQPPEATSFTLRPVEGQHRRTPWVIAAAAVIALGAVVVTTRAPTSLSTSAPAVTPPASTLLEGTGEASPPAPTPSEARRVSTLRIEPWPADAEVRLDGVELSAPHVVEVRRDVPHQVEVRAKGYVTRVFDVEAPNDLILQASLVAERPRAERRRRESTAPPAPSSTPTPNLPRAPPHGARALDLSDPW